MRKVIENFIRTHERLLFFRGIDITINNFKIYSRISMPELNDPADVQAQSPEVKLTFNIQFLPMDSFTVVYNFEKVGEPKIHEKNQYKLPTRSSPTEPILVYGSSLVLLH